MKLGFDNYMGLDILTTEVKPDKDMRATLDVTKEEEITSLMENFWTGKGETEHNCFLLVPYGDILRWKVTGNCSSLAPSKIRVHFNHKLPLGTYPLTWRPILSLTTSKTPPVTVPGLNDHQILGILMTQISSTFYFEFSIKYLVLILPL